MGDDAYGTAQLGIVFVLGDVGDGRRVSGIGDVDYLHAVVFSRGDQRVVFVSYRVGGDVRGPVELGIGAVTVGHACDGRGVFRVGDVDYLHAVVGIGGDQRVVPVSYRVGSDTYGPVELGIGGAMCHAGNGRRVFGIGDVDYLHAVVVITSDQRVMVGSYRVDDNAPRSVELGIGGAMCHAGNGRRVFGIGDVDYLHAVVGIGGDQRVVAASYRVDGDGLSLTELVKRPGAGVRAPVLYAESIEAYWLSKADADVDGLAGVVLAVCRGGSDACEGCGVGGACRLPVHLEEQAVRPVRQHAHRECPAALGDVLEEQRAVSTYRRGLDTGAARAAGGAHVLELDVPAEGRAISCADSQVAPPAISSSVAQMPPTNG